MTNFMYRQLTDIYYIRHYYILKSYFNNIFGFIFYDNISKNIIKQKNKNPNLYNVKS